MNSKPVNPVDLVEKICCSKDSGRNDRDRRAVLADWEPSGGIRAGLGGSADGNGSPGACRKGEAPGREWRGAV